MAPSTFASALAGNNQNEHPTRDAASEWSRRTNGATQTFRRSSTATSVSSAIQQPDANTSSQNPPRYVPPHRNGTFNDMRYSKDQLLDLYRAQNPVEAGLGEDLPSLFVGGWQPSLANGAGNANWNRGDQSRDIQLGPDICWDRDGSTEPLGLLEMNDDERELFSSSVNTQLKPPSTSKDSQQANGHPGRKISMSGQGNVQAGSGPLSPASTRGPGRRRDTSDSFPFPANPMSPSATGGASRDDQRAASPPPSLLRRRTDLKDTTRLSERDEGDEKSASTPYSTLKRHPTGPLSAGITAPTSPWSTGPQSAGLSPMGSFGNFGLGQSSNPAEKRPGMGGARAESRFKNLLNKDSGEEIPSKSVERKTSMSSLSRVNENESWRPHQNHDMSGDAALDETEEDLPFGSAALAADADVSPPQHRQQGGRGFGTPSRGDSRDEFGNLSSFAMAAGAPHAFGQGMPSVRESFQQTPSQSRQVGGREPMSPTDTNPYQSPEQHSMERLMEDEPDQSELQHTQMPAVGGFGVDQGSQFSSLGGLAALPNLGRAAPTQGSAGDRSQTSSVGGGRAFPGLGGLGQLGGISGAAAWSAGQGGLGTPNRQSAGISGPFGGGLFNSSMGDIQSPSLAGLGPAGGFGSTRMTSMFPPAMQEQMLHGEQDREVGINRPGQPSMQGLNDYGRNADSPFVGQGLSENQADLDKSMSHLGAPGQQSGIPVAQQQDQTIQMSGGQLQGQLQAQQPSSSASNQPPPPQQRTMVMPDRMRWIYRDPQGQTQGPWSGLEMHDWYKAGFFSPELLVKKLEDPDYEPLAQLIRRIGNSREPFLVPQIGIPHGQPSSSGPNAWAGTGTVSTGTAPAGGAQPPFASSFPSFGTTLTAEQQNALERRKQEEQYLMARQKEHLAQAQLAQRIHHPMQPGAVGGPHAGGLGPAGQLHHSHSGQSLHSQPSFGSITSPSAGGYQPSPVQAPQGQAQGFFDHSFRAPGQASGLGAIGAGMDTLGNIREEEIPGLMSRLNVGGRGGAGQFSAPGQQFNDQHQSAGSSAPEQHDHQVQQMMQDRARLQQEQVAHDTQHQQQSDDQANRLEQFQQLQSQGISTGLDARFQHGKPAAIATEQSAPTEQSRLGSSDVVPHGQQPRELSLTEQVQKAATAQQSPAPQQPGLPQPFPPPSQSPLPAPAAQRTGRQTVADHLQNEQRDSSQTPSVETPSAAIAPWAKEQTEASKGPSLKEIQEMEAKKAAEAEEIAITARRAAVQKEMEAQAQAQAITAAAAPALPAASNWAAAGGAPAANATTAAWAKAAQKPTAPSTAKSMAQIQKEEEARKKRAAAAASAQMTAMSNVAAPAGGKSYANLAGKVTAPPLATNQSGGAWTTVGASGKVKPPVAPASATSAASPSAVPTTQTAAAMASKKPTQRSSTMSNSGAANAQDEFKKWAVGELRPDLNKGISAEDFVASLVFLPPDADIITEAVHGVSSTIDSRHFAEEFIRRKRLADKGLIDSTSAPPRKSASPHHRGTSADKSGGWSEVAKKGPQREGSSAAAAKDGDANGNGNGNFRVVAPKKKAGKR